MSDPEHSPIIGKPMFDDDDPSGGWGLVLLVGILIAVFALAVWFALGRLP